MSGVLGALASRLWFVAVAVPVIYGFAGQLLALAQLLGAWS